MYEHEPTNPACPDHVSPWENAADYLFPDRPRARGGVVILTPDESEQVDAHAMAEYLNCEGH